MRATKAISLIDDPTIALAKSARRDGAGAYGARGGIATQAELAAALRRQKTMTHLRLGDALVQEQLITTVQRDAALAAQAIGPRVLLGEILVRQGSVTADQVRRILIEQLGVPWLDLARFPREVEAAEALGDELSRKYIAVALYVSDTRLGIAMENAMWWEALQDIESATKRKLDVAMADGDEIRGIIHARDGGPPPAPKAVGDLERMRVLSARVLSIQEEERHHISRDLHDDVGQSLTALKLGLHRLAAVVTGEAAEVLAACVTMADATLDRVRQLAYDLRPPQLDELGMEEALRWLVERQRTLSGIDIKCHFNGLLHRRFPEAIESACYRITQEALSNATRHARANSILVTLEASARRLRLTIRDDGTGFDAAARKALPKSSLGLISMEERAGLAGGCLSVGSEAGQGTMVRAIFELNAPEAAS